MQEFHFTDVTASSLQPPKWVVKGLIPDHSLGQIFGTSGVGKSFLAVDLACSVATGTSFHGRVVKRTGPVFYIAGEGHRGYLQRFRAWQNVYRLSLEGRIWMSNQACSLMDRASVKAVVASICELTELHGPAALVIIDTLARNFGGGDENDTKQMGCAINALDSIRSSCDCTLIIIHHTGLGTAERARGSSSLRGALDFEFALERHGKALALVPKKTKDAEDPEITEFELVKVDLGILDEEGEPVTSAVLKPIGNAGHDSIGLPETQERVLEFFRNNPEVAFGPRELNESTGVSIASLEKALPAMAKSGWLIKPGRGKYCLNPEIRNEPENPDFRVAMNSEIAPENPESIYRMLPFPDSDHPELDLVESLASPGEEDECGTSLCPSPGTVQIPTVENPMKNTEETPCQVQ